MKNENPVDEHRIELTLLPIILTFVNRQVN